MVFINETLFSHNASVTESQIFIMKEYFGCKISCLFLQESSWPWVQCTHQELIWVLIRHMCRAHSHSFWHQGGVGGVMIQLLQFTNRYSLIISATMLCLCKQVLSFPFIPWVPVLYFIGWVYIYGCQLL